MRGRPWIGGGLVAGRLIARSATLSEAAFAQEPCEKRL